MNAGIAETDVRRRRLTLGAVYIGFHFIVRNVRSLWKYSENLHLVRGTDREVHRVRGYAQTEYTTIVRS
jgi:hypothetical protein